MQNDRPLPMLAKPYDPAKHDKLLAAGHLVVEEKYDGHRCVVRVSHDGEAPLSEAWSRTGIDCSHKLSSHLRDALKSFPTGVYDCELIVPGHKSTDVVRLELAGKRQLVVFDLLELHNVNICDMPWSDRRTRLQETVGANNPHVFTSPVIHDIRTPQQLDSLVGNIWAAKGEGVIVKDRRSIYSPGKRRDAFLKIKDCGSCVVTVIGFEAGTTSAYNVAVVKDDAGNVTGVKLKDDLTRQQALDEGDTGSDEHPWIGRRLRIEFHERTRDGLYRHPRWDRWEDE